VIMGYFDGEQEDCTKYLLLDIGIIWSADSPVRSGNVAAFPAEEDIDNRVQLERLVRELP